MISMDKQYRTKDGREVRIYAVDGGGYYPVHGAYLHDGEWIICRWNKNGAHPAIPNIGLVEVLPRIQREYWVNVPKGKLDRLDGFTSKNEIDKRRTDNTYSCVKITIDCEEGEGL